MYSVKSVSRWMRPITGVALLIACGAPLDESPSSDEGTSEDQFASQDETELGSSEEALTASCVGSDDSNLLAAGLAVAIAKELGRWDVNTDFIVNNGGGPTALRVEMSGNADLAGGVPEPAAWSLMIAGFGMAGAVLRRRRSATA